MIKWGFGLLALGFVIFMAERQLSFLTFAGLAGASGQLVRDDVTVPVTLFAEGTQPAGRLGIHEKFRVHFGDGSTFLVPDAGDVACRFWVEVVACSDGWSFQFTGADGRE